MEEERCAEIRERDTACVKEVKRTHNVCSLFEHICDKMLSPQKKQQRMDIPTSYKV